MLIVTEVTDELITLQNVLTLETCRIQYYDFNKFYSKNKAIYRVIYDGRLKTVTDIGIYKLVQFESITSRDEYIRDNGLLPADYLEINSGDYPKLIVCTGREMYEHHNITVKERREKDKEKKREKKPTDKITDKPKASVADTRLYVVYCECNGKRMYWRDGSSKTNRTTFNIYEAMLMDGKTARSKAYYMSINGHYIWKALKVIEERKNELIGV